VEEVEAGVWLVKTARIIPENELWLHTRAREIWIERSNGRGGIPPKNPTSPT